MVGACKKIVRLILMSNISRRKFLKGAGAAVLAVAASGVLAGCSGSEEKVPMKEVVVIFKNKVDGKEVAPRGTVKVPAADGTVDPSKVTAPDNYVVVDNKPVEIKTYTPAENAKPEDKAYEYIEVTVAFGDSTRTVKVKFVCDGKAVKTVEVNAKFNASVVAASAFESKLPKEYEIIDAQKEYAITDGEVNVFVQVRTVDVEYYFYYTKKIALGITTKIEVMSFKKPMLATVKSVPNTDSNIPAVAFIGDDGKKYKVVEPRPATYPVKNGVENGKIEIEVKAV